MVCWLWRGKRTLKHDKGTLKELRYVYTDASFSKAHHLAVMGYVIFNNHLEHELADVSQQSFHLHSMTEDNNIRAEVRGAILALKACETGANVILFSDCQTVVGLPRRQEKLIATNFIGKKKNLIINNADIYQAFYKEFDRIGPEIYWVAGHALKNKKTKIDKNFSYVDKQVRKKLREMIRMERY